MSPQLLVNMAVIIEYTIRGEEGKRSLSLSPFLRVAMLFIFYPQDYLSSSFGFSQFKPINPRRDKHGG